MLSGLMARLHRPIYAHRLRVLADTIVPRLRPGDRVLDVGCGIGTLGRALLDHPNAPGGLVVEGIERVRRGGEPIQVHAYDGIRLPFTDGAYDVVIVADVLHHEPEPLRLLRECARVARRAVVVKDHRVRGPISQTAVSFIDWAANAPYGVPCLYRYNTLAQWRALPEQLGLERRFELTSMSLYPAVVNAVFGGSLQYLAVWERAGEGGRSA